MRTLFVIVYLFLVSSSYSNDLAIDVFNNLWEHLKADDTIKPDLEIVKSDKVVARYSPSNNVVYLGVKALNVCLNSVDPKASLAFLLGHELAHSIQDQIQKYNIETNFLRFDRQAKTRLALEENADLNGAFTAYLSGYEVQDVISKLIEDLYNAYGLMDKNLVGYPSFDERSNTSNKLKAKLDRLIELYRIGSHLLETSEEKFSIAFFEEILSEYKGAEVYNNLGVAYASLALNYGGYNYERFVYPLEIEFDTRLLKPTIDYNAKDLNFQLQIKRSELLKKSLGYFETALSDYPDYNKAKINLVSVLNMMGAYEEATQILTESNTDYPLLEAITLLNQDLNNQYAISILKELLKTQQGRALELIHINLNRINCKETVNPLEPEETPLLPLSQLQNVDYKYVEVIGESQDHFYKHSPLSSSSFFVGCDQGFIEITLSP